MAVSGVSKVTVGTVATQSSFATGSWTPTASRLEIATVVTRRSATPTTPTLSGNGLTWTQAANYVFDTAGTEYRITIFVALSGASPSAGALTADYAAVNQSACVICVDEFDGADISGTALGAIVQTKDGPVDAASALSLTITLTSAITSGNASFGVMCHQAITGTVTAGSGYTKLSDQTVGGANWTFTELKAAGSTTVDGSWSVSGVPGGEALEIKSVGVGGTLSATFPSMSGQLSGLESYSGTITATFPSMSGQLIGIEHPRGTIAASFPKMAAQLSGVQIQRGTLVATFPKMTAQLTGRQRPGHGGITITGQIAASFPKMSAQLAGTQGVRGTLAATFPSLSGSFLAYQYYIGTLTGTFPSMTAQLSGYEKPSGSIVATFPMMSAALAGFVPETGTIVATFPAMTAALAGDLPVIGTLIASFPSMTAALSGALDITGTLAATFPKMTAVLAGAATSINVSIRLIPRMEGVFIHNYAWPGERVWEVTSWHNYNPHWQRFEAGNADLDVANSESDYNAFFAKGFVLVGVFPNTPVWAGPLITLSRDSSTGARRLDALGIAALLDGQDAPQSVHYKQSIGSGGVFRDLLASVNRLAHSGITKGRIENGPSIKDLQVGGQSAWQSFAELHKRTNLEYWVDVEVSPAHLTARLNWAARQGLDLSDSVHLWEGVHFGRIVDKDDSSQEKAAQTAMGDFGAPISERNSVTVLASGKKANNGAALRRNLSQLPAGLRNTRIFHVPPTGNSDELEREARRAMVRPLNSSRTFALEVPLGVVDWMDLFVGNTYMVHPIATPDAIVRTVGFDPDVERGVLDIVGEEVR